MPALRAPEDGDSPIMVPLTALAFMSGYATFFLCMACMALFSLWCTFLPPPHVALRLAHGGDSLFPMNGRTRRWMTSWPCTACGCWARMP